MSQATMPSTTIHPLPPHSGRHYGRAVFAAIVLVVATATTLLVVAWTRDGTSTPPAKVPAVTRVAPRWNTPECPRVGYC